MSYQRDKLEELDKMVQNALFEQMLVNYQNAVLNAAKEVSLFNKPEW